MDPLPEDLLTSTRRTFLQRGVGLGAIAFGALDGTAVAGQESAGVGKDSPLAPKSPPLPAKAKRVLYPSMSGAPPQHDTFDFKPKLQALDGTPCPEALFEGKRLAFIKGHPKLLASPHPTAPAPRHPPPAEAGGVPLPGSAVSRQIESETVCTGKKFGNG